MGAKESSKEAVSPAARYPDSGEMENGLYAGAAGCNAARSAARTGAGGSFLKRESGTVVCGRVGERGGLKQCSVLTCVAGAQQGEAKHNERGEARHLRHAEEPTNPALIIIIITLTLTHPNSNGTCDMR